MRQALELALESLEDYVEEYGPHEKDSGAAYAITAIKEALAQPEQEPVGKFAKFTDGIWREVTDGSAGVPLYTTPPQRTWVGLTDDDEIPWDGVDAKSFAQAIEAKLKEKNT